MKQRWKNIVAIVLAAALLAGGLFIRFSPNVTLKDVILSLVELPQSIFHAIWPEKEETEVEEEIPANPGETPLVVFDNHDEEEPNQSKGPDTPLIIAPDSDQRPKRELPLDVFPQTNGETP